MGTPRRARAATAAPRIHVCFISQLLGAVTELLVDADKTDDHSSPRRRFLAYRRALGYADKLDHAITVDELATEVGVSRRVLELGFKESFDISPQRYLRYVRLNGLHRDLRCRLRSQSTVAEAIQRWGFGELGRTSVEYRRLFGETPSTTLARDGRIDCPRYADALT